MSLGLGANSAKSSGGGTSESYGYSGSNSQDLSQSSQSSVGGGQSSTTQGIAFEDIYKQLFGGAAGAAGGALAQAPELAAAAKQLFTGGTQFMQGLGGDAGTEYLADRLSGTGVVDEQIDLLREDTGRLFSESLNPAITSRAVAGGSLGGGRQGVAQTGAMESVGRAFTSGATQLRVADQSSKDAIAAQVAGNSLTAASTGLGALPGLLDLQERGNNAELGTYASLSSILGGPTVLSQSQGTNFSESTAQSISEALSRSFGEQTGTSQNWSRGKASGWNFSAGVGPQ